MLSIEPELRLKVHILFPYMGLYVWRDSIFPLLNFDKGVGTVGAFVYSV